MVRKFPKKFRPNHAPVQIPEGFNIHPHIEWIDTVLRIAFPDEFSGISTYPDGRVELVFTDAPENVDVVSVTNLFNGEIDKIPLP